MKHQKDNQLDKLEKLSIEELLLLAKDLKIDIKELLQDRPELLGKLKFI